MADHALRHSEFVFFFGSEDAYHIDKWFRFALSKKVEKLELNLIPHKAGDIIGLDIPKPSLGVPDNGFTFLKSLYLNSINVSGDFLECLLSRSFLLERLYVGCSKTLVRWKVDGSACKLKHLTIHNCSLEELEIDAVNLIYFEYLSCYHSPNIKFKSAPGLVEAAIGGRIVKGPIFQQISHLASQISKLYLDVEFHGFPSCVLPTFCNLKQLSLQVHDGKCEFDLSGITHLLAACPVLHELKLQMFRWDCSLQDAAYVLRNDVKAEDVLIWEYFYKMERQTHRNLKVLQVVSFRGCDLDIEVILFLVVFACNLETIVCDSSYDYPEEEILEASRSRAHKLMKIIPPKISVVTI